MSERANFTILGSWHGQQIIDAVMRVAGDDFRQLADGKIGRADPYPYKSLMVMVGDEDGSELHTLIRPDGNYTTLSMIVYTRWNSETYLVRYYQDDIDGAAEKFLRAIEAELNNGTKPLS